MGSGQVLPCPYPFDRARLIAREMAELLVLDLVDKGLMTNQIVLSVGYDALNLKDEASRKAFRGEVTIDSYGRSIPKGANGSISLDRYTSSTQLIVGAVLELFDRIADPNLLVKGELAANNILDEKAVAQRGNFQQLDLFTDYEAQKRKEEQLERERKFRKRLWPSGRDLGRTPF